MKLEPTAGMQKARKLLAANPATDRTALAKRVGLTRDALYKDPVCAEIIRQYRKSKQTK